MCGVRLGCGLDWFVGPKFSLCDGLGWVEEIAWTHGQLWGLVQDLVEFLAGTVDFSTNLFLQNKILQIGYCVLD